MKPMRNDYSFVRIQTFTDVNVGDRYWRQNVTLKM